MSMHRGKQPIFVLDSGLGGLTVASALLKRLPDERIVYFGDTARLPYGSKTAETVTHFIRQIIQFGAQFHPKRVVIACNTASALALPAVQDQFAPLPITGVIEAGARAACAAAGSNPHATIGVIATEATVRSEAYQIAIRRRRRLARLLIQPTPLLVALIEEGRSLEDPLVELALRQYLKPMMDRKLDVLLLGCTHYPLLAPLIRQIVGPRVTVIDSAEQCAEDVAAKLAASGAEPFSAAVPESDRLEALVTDDPVRFQKLAARFLGFEVARPEWVEPEILYRHDDAIALRGV